MGLPFRPQAFDLVTASNLVFLCSDPDLALAEMKHRLRPGGKLAMLNPSETLDESSALAFVNEKGLGGLARDTLLN